MPVSLVTGARGFVGGWLARALLDRGERVAPFDRRSSTEKPSAIGMLGIEDELVQVEGDLCDGEELERVLRENRVDTAFHPAAETIVSTRAGLARSRRSGLSQGFESNVRGTWTLLQACLESGVDRVILASSDKAYGAHDELPYREDFPLQPTAPYEASKAAADLIARSYWHSYGLPVAVTRFANIYGGGDLNGPGGGERGARRARSGAALRRDPGARLPLRGGRGVRVSDDRRRARPRRRPRRGVQRRERTLVPGRRCGGADREARRLGAGGRPRGWASETIDWYRDHPDARAPARSSVT